MSNSKLSEEALANAYRECTRRPDWPSPTCPDPAALGRLALGEAPADERRLLADHLVDCTGCAEWVRNLRSLEGWAERASNPARQPSIRWRQPLLIAAVLLMAFGSAWLWRGQSGQSGQSAKIDNKLRGSEVAVMPAPGAELSQVPDRFAWPNQPGATGYRVKLQNDRGEPLWQSDWTAETSIQLSLTAAEDLSPGSYLWTVELRGGADRQRLGPFVFGLNKPAND